ncbi:MAG: branched-chain amino acid ABC transporter substrate-binding protein [Actinomycetales bacterium]|nr:branched-chain amino acid ABC transporter substrate-binding protein [Actinomycetales bacterium]
MRTTRIFRSAAVLAVAVLAVAGCGGDDGADSAKGGDTCGLSIAFFGAQTGDAANLGINISNGAQLAVDQYNAKNADCPVTLEKFDSQGSPDQAPALAQRIIQKTTIVGVVGPTFSGESKVADPIFNEAGVPLVSASATGPALSEQSWKVFHRVVGSDAVQGPAAAKYIRDTLKAEKVFVVDDASEYGKELADILKAELGDAVVGSDTVQVKQTDFSATVTRIKSSGATVFYFGGYYPEAGLLRKQLTDAGGKDILLVSDDGVRDAGYVEAAGAEAAEGTVVTCPCVPPDKASGTFAADYQKAFNTAPGTYSAEAYDAATVFLDGIAAGKTTRADLLTWVKSYNKQGITKKVQFDPKGDVADKTVWTYVFKNGEIVPDQPVQ